MKKIIQNHGYSIAEVIVYLAIFAMVSLMVINSFIVVISSFATTRTNRDLLESGLSSMERISREIRQAKSIDIVASTLDSTPGILQLNSTDENDVSMVIKFVNENGDLNIYKNGVLIGNLINENITVQSIIYRRIATTEGEAVKIEMSLQDTPGKTVKVEKFYDTINLRGKYQ